MMTELPSAGRRSRSADATVCWLCKKDGLGGPPGVSRPGLGAPTSGRLGGSQQSRRGSTSSGVLLPPSCWAVGAKNQSKPPLLGQVGGWRAGRGGGMWAWGKQGDFRSSAAFRGSLGRPTVPTSKSRRAKHGGSRATLLGSNHSHVPLYNLRQATAALCVSAETQLS